MGEGIEILKHRSRFTVRSIKSDGDPFMAVASLVVDWLVDKERQYDGSPIAEDLGGAHPFPRAWDYCMPRDYRGGAYDADRWPALACACGFSEDDIAMQWVVEYDDPDTSDVERRWHTTVCLERVPDRQGVGADADNAPDAPETSEVAEYPGTDVPEDPSVLPCRVSVQSVCRAVVEGGRPLPETVATPALVRSIIDLPWHKATVGPTLLQTVPNKLSPQTFPQFAEALVDPARTLPFVLFSTGFDGKVPEQAKQLARRAMGIANVYVLDWSNEELRSQEETLFARGTSAGQYACPRNSCRMYLPGLDLTDPSHSMTHKSWNRLEMEELRPSQFAERLARRFIPSQPVKTIAELMHEPGVSVSCGGADDAYEDSYDYGYDDYDDDREGRFDDFDGGYDDDYSGGYGDSLDARYDDPYGYRYDQHGRIGRREDGYDDDYDRRYDDRYSDR